MGCQMDPSFELFLIQTVVTQTVVCTIVSVAANQKREADEVAAAGFFPRSVVLYLMSIAI